MGYEKFDMNIVIVGHVDLRKPTRTGHSIRELGGIDERVVERCEKQAAAMNKSVEMKDPNWRQVQQMCY